jgi:nucleoside-diphosphate-sugar epimerase
MALKDSGDKVHVIFGNGPVGSAAARYLLGKGFKVRMASRSGRRPSVLFDDLPAEAAQRLEFVPADATNPEDALRAARGASHIYHCANVVYQDWWKLLPPIQENLIAAALRENAVLAVTENLYMYARGTAVIDETTPETPPTRKGLLRKELHDRLVAAGKSQGLAWTSVRASDYYGPGAGLQSMFGTNLFLDPVFNGKRPRVVGALDQLHSVTFVEDYGRALAVAALDPRAYGRSWIVPNDRARTTRETAQVFFDAAGRKKKLGVIPRPLIAAMGIFSPLLREVVEMLYQKEEPYVVDGASFARPFGFTPTPLEEGVRRTLEWYGKAQRTRANQTIEKAVT